MPRAESRTFCSRLCETSTLPQLWQNGPQPSTAVSQSRKGVPSGPWEAVLSLLREKPDCQGISQGPLSPADLSFPPREPRGGREPRTASNKLKNKSDPWRGQKAARPLQEPLPTKRQVGRAEAAQNPKVRAHAVSAQSTQSLWLFRATQRQQLPPCSPRLRVQSSFEGMTELRA